MQSSIAMTLLDRIAAKRRREEEETPERATCLRCRRQYTPDRGRPHADEYCWWCAERVDVESPHE